MGFLFYCTERFGRESDHCIIARTDILSKFQRKTTRSQFALRVVRVSTSTKQLCGEIKVLHRLHYYLFNRYLKTAGSFLKIT